MTPLNQLTAMACPLGLSNVDTDQLIPARFMKRSRGEGYGQFLLHDLRFDQAGAAVPDFPLNMPQADSCRILVARRNFGGGSSREAAVYALVDFGFRCVIAPSFGDIFTGNAVNNGLLPARVAESDCAAILKKLDGAVGTISVDLERQEIGIKGTGFAFEIDPTARRKLLNGWDDIDLTAQYAAEINRFVRQDATRRPWAQSIARTSPDPVTQKPADS
ncbi:3-isopropylmalate/(R)-2-methylmalate dehydratase small subunit [Natronocella acetinitrilica]|uniref:3-isopropylmalate dehydratase n=1 Tax=Natronocella acetinitrilica TaxID=414046 RepID=A0AAE3G9F9_9GAMM|nr:3-isopropylmalate dehydratase small subunit [Natronocella acetinitrilica]MCP1676933.1 3-isopropylmalate/(R)-2-methylmalate dehydratase small subunit [Natronocella acetinitrilica]